MESTLTVTNLNKKTNRGFWYLKMEVRDLGSKSASFLLRFVVNFRGLSACPVGSHELSSKLNLLKVSWQLSRVLSPLFIRNYVFIFLLGVVACFFVPFILHDVCFAAWSKGRGLWKKPKTKFYTKSSLVITTQINILRNKSNSDFMD